MFCILLFNSLSYVFLLLCMLYSVYSVLSCQLAFSGYPDWGFSMLFPQLLGKCWDIIHKDGARPGLSPISSLCCSVYCLCRLCCSMYCLCVHVYCTTATGCQPNCNKQIHHIILLKMNAVCGLNCHWKWSQHGTLKWWGPFTQQHSIKSQKTRNLKIPEDSSFCLWTLLLRSSNIFAREGHFMVKSAPFFFKLHLFVCQVLVLKIVLNFNYIIYKPVISMS